LQSYAKTFSLWRTKRLKINLSKVKSVDIDVACLGECLTEVEGTKTELDDTGLKFCVLYARGLVLYLEAAPLRVSTISN
jgi:hypothetical protein